VRLPKASRRQLLSDFLAHAVGLQGPQWPPSHKDVSWPSLHLNRMIASIVDLPCRSPSSRCGPLAGRRFGAAAKTDSGLEPVRGVAQSQRELARLSGDVGHAWLRHGTYKRGIQQRADRNGTPPISPLRHSWSALISKNRVMAVAGRGYRRLQRFSAQVSQPAISSSHHACCGMGWLDSGARWFGPGVSRVSMISAPR